VKFFASRPNQVSTAVLASAARVKTVDNRPISPYLTPGVYVKQELSSSWNGRSWPQ